MEHLVTYECGFYRSNCNLSSVIYFLTINMFLLYHMHHHPPDDTPLEIKLRGPDAIAAYQKASQDGTQKLCSIRLMLVGQERVGKTSLMKAFMGKR